MPAVAKAKHIDRDDFDADHYADFLRDSHRSRLTLDQLDIAKRQLYKTEKLLSHVHYLKMKEHTRVKNDFLRKLEQDTHLSNLPSVKEKLKGERRKHAESSSPPLSTENTQDLIDESPKQEQTSPKTNRQSKLMTRADTPRTERLKANIDKFKNTDSLLVV